MLFRSEAVHSLIECNESMCEVSILTHDYPNTSSADQYPQVPEDLAMILNDSSLFSNSADITTKEILKRYGDRAKAPTYGSAPSGLGANNGTTSPTPVATRIDPDVQNAWQNESSVRHVGSDLTNTPPPDTEKRTTS